MSKLKDIELGKMINSKSVTVTFSDVVYEIKHSLDDVPICGKKEMKDILKSVSGVFPPGLNAIMGPTGSGKTSLLDILAKRKDPVGLKSGLVLINEEEHPDNFQLMSGYVVQDDIVMGTLTVRENLMFSANLRLSCSKVTQQERNRKVQKIIRNLGLQHCADTKVGTEFIRGISGGERKRVNIGMELILDPPVMFLDEPTTGLDSNTANSILLLLKKFAKQGKNIILSIHQPRYSIFSLFNELLVLAHGEVVYRGKSKSAVTHFSSIGYPCPLHHNPADFILDVVGGDETSVQLLGRMQAQDQNDDDVIDQIDNEFNVIDIDVLESAKEDEDIKRGRILADKFKDSSLAQKQEETIQNIIKTYKVLKYPNPMKKRHVSATSVFVHKIKIGIQKALSKVSKNKNGYVYETVRHQVGFDDEYPNSYFHQFKIVSQRTFRNLIRNPVTSVAQAFMMVFFAVLIGLIYYQVDKTNTGLQNRTGCFFFLTMMHVMSNLSALELFISNRKFFMHESASGYYRVSVYFISSILADVLPHRIIPNLFFSTIVYLMIGFQPIFSKFAFFIVAQLATNLASTTAAFLVSASVRAFSVANIVLAIPFLLMMMFGGFLVNTGSLLSWLQWIKWVSIFKYGYEAMIVNEMSGLVFYNNETYEGFDPDSSQPCMHKTQHYRLITCVTGEEFMEAQDIDYGSEAMWFNVKVLGAMTFTFLVLTYVQMRRISKYK